MAPSKPLTPLESQGGVAMANLLFVIGIISSLAIFVILSLTPRHQGNADGRHEDQAAIDARDAGELARRYGMTVDEYLNERTTNPWGSGGDRDSAAWRRGDGSTHGLFGQQLTPTYAPHLLGVAKLRTLRGAVVNPKAKKDRNLWPLNTDYDLYSMGKDGKTSTLLSADESQDDIIRANNGQYFGLASEY